MPPSTQTRVWDVAIVGAGPAGSCAAMQLASAGHSVLLLDRDKFPRPKVCGDGLIPDALNSLKRLGLYDEVSRRGHEVSQVTVYSPSRVALDLSGHFITMKRAEFDSLLVERACDRGAIFKRAAVIGISETPDGTVAVHTRGGPTHTARLAVLATGSDVTLLEAAGVACRRRPSALALRCYVTSSAVIEQMIVSFDKTITPGYGWIFPLGNHEYNVGCGFFFRGTSGETKQINLRDAFNTFVTELPIARALMRGATWQTPLKGARLRCGLEGAASYSAGRVVAVGETLGTTYPFTGEGIGKAMESAMLAAERVNQALRDDRLDALADLESLIRTRLAPRYVGYQIAARWLAKPWLTDFLVRRVRSSRPLQDTANRILNETADPRQVFTWRAFLPEWARRLGPA